MSAMKALSTKREVEPSHVFEGAGIVEEFSSPLAELDEAVENSNGESCKEKWINHLADAASWAPKLNPGGRTKARAPNRGFRSSTSQSTMYAFGRSVRQDVRVGSFEGWCG